MNKKTIDTAQNYIKEEYKSFLLLALAAFLYTLGFPNILSILIPITPIIGTAILLFHLFKDISTKQRIAYYLFYNSVINALSFYWITNTLQEFGNLPFIVAAIMNSAYALILNPQYFFLIALLHIINKYHSSYNKYIFTSGLFTAALAAFLTSLEYFIPQQFPVMLGQPWIIFSEYLGAAAFLGLPVFSFMSYLLGAELVSGFRNKHISLINLLSILIFIFVNPFLIPQERSNSPIVDFNVRLV